MAEQRAQPIAVLFGTRPEVIKLAPVILELRRRNAPTVVVATGQHRELVDDLLQLFDIAVDEQLSIMRTRQSIDHVLSRAITLIGRALDRHRPAAVVVQGDTTSALGASFSAFHRHLPLAHVEAGLRSGDLDLPFPEELNRRVISIVARWHFAPTAAAAENLRREEVSGSVCVTGNTVVDAMQLIAARGVPLSSDLAAFIGSGPLLLATAHRRESWTGGIAAIAGAVSDVLDAIPALRVIFVTHPNPVARTPVEDALGQHKRARVVDAVLYSEFIALLQRATLVVSDSGGVQEEGPTLGVPVLVTRAVTERPEGLAAGAVRLVGTDRETIRDTAIALLNDEAARRTMSTAGRTIYGDGQAARRIVDVLLDKAAC
jgi:UDP-N-acetylglucosamine 2-epimerase (non-hydrolysing)